MKLKYWSLCVFNLISIGLIGFPTLQAQINVQQVAQFQSAVDSVFKANPSTRGISVWVESPTKAVSWGTAVGNSTIAGAPLLLNSPCNIASNTKTYVAAALLRLVEQGQLHLQDLMGEYLTPATRQLMLSAGYQLDRLTVLHLLTHTSGVQDFVHTDYYQSESKNNPKHHWTPEEQTALAFKGYSPLFQPGAKFSYSDQNYLLLTEIIEHFTQIPFHVATRKLLKLDELQLANTWFLVQEAKPEKSMPYAEQTATSYQVNSLVLDPSFDAYGGGGLAATPEDLAKFIHHVFNGKVFDHPATVDLLFTTLLTKDGVPPTYSLGLKQTLVSGYSAYGHGGFWGTQVKYIPALNTTIAVFVMERDTWKIAEQLLEILALKLTAN